MAADAGGDATFLYGGLSLFGPSRLTRRSNRQQGLAPEAVAAVTEACGQCVAQDDACAIAKLTPMKKVRRSDCADDSAFRKEQRRMTGVRKAEREQATARQAAASLASAKQTRRAKEWECHRLLEGHDWLANLCVKVDVLNDSFGRYEHRTPRQIMSDYFRVRLHEECLGHLEAVERLLFEYKYLNEQRPRYKSFLGSRSQIAVRHLQHQLAFDWHGHGYQDTIDI